MANYRIIQIKKEIDTDLALRDIADHFFDKLETTPDEKIQIDFSGVLSISRSFAHEYTVRKDKSHKTITEINVPENVEKMFRVVEDKNKNRVLDLNSIEIGTV